MTDPLAEHAAYLAALDRLIAVEREGLAGGRHVVLIQAAPGAAHELVPAAVLLQPGVLAAGSGDDLGHDFPPRDVAHGSRVPAPSVEVCPVLGTATVTVATRRCLDK